MNKTFKKIAATALAAITLASTMATASATVVTDANWNSLPVRYWHPDGYAAYAEFTKAELDAFYAENGQNQYWYKDTFGLGGVVGVFEKGMSFEDAYMYASRLRLKDAKGNLAFIELYYNDEADRYFMRSAAWAKSASQLLNDSNFEQCIRYFKYNNTEYGLPGSYKATAAKMNACYPQLSFIDTTTGKTLAVDDAGPVGSNSKDAKIVTEYLSKTTASKYGEYRDVIALQLNFWGHRELVNPDVNQGRIATKYQIKPIVVVPDEPKTDDDDGGITPPPPPPVVPKYTVTSTSGSTVYVTLNKNAAFTANERAIVLDNTRDDINLIKSCVYHDLLYTGKLNGKTYIKVKWSDGSSTNNYSISDLK